MDNARPTFQDAEGRAFVADTVTGRPITGTYPADLVAEQDFTAESTGSKKKKMVQLVPARIVAALPNNPEMEAAQEARLAAQRAKDLTASEKVTAAAAAKAQRAADAAAAAAAAAAVADEASSSRETRKREREEKRKV